MIQRREQRFDPADYGRTLWAAILLLCLGAASPAFAGDLKHEVSLSDFAGIEVRNDSG